MSWSERYSRQILFSQLGETGQLGLAKAHILIVGCGALGGVQAELMARAGVGHITLIDRDIIEPSNLQRQVLFDESQLAEQKPKAIAAQERLERINSQITVRGVVTDLRPVNIEYWLKDIDLVLDGTDNFETRYLINDACIKLDIPWIYGACVGSYGITATIIPRRTPCLRCLFDSMPAPGVVQTCDTAGVIGPIVTSIASFQSAEALKILANRREALRNTVLHVDLWDGTLAQIKTGEPKPQCPACQLDQWEYLAGQHHAATASICGRNTVQILPSKVQAIDLARIALQLQSYGTVTSNAFLLRCKLTKHTLTLFADGRALIEGTSDPAEARSLYARLLG